MTSTPEHEQRHEHAHEHRHAEPDDVDASVERVDPAAVAAHVTDPRSVPSPSEAPAEPVADASAEPSGEVADETVTTGTAAPASKADTEPEPAPEAAAPAPQPEPTTPTLEELELALAALDEVAPKGAVGEVRDALLEPGRGPAQVVAIRHASTLAGYPDWSWTVLLSRGLEGGPTVLEVALLPGETSLLAPAWVPWADRLADYLAAKEAAGADDDELEGEDDELESDLEEDLEDDFDDDFDVEAAAWDDEAGEPDVDGEGLEAVADGPEADAEPDDAR
ncbi:DUF3027 domain-containing protein [Agrococcus carbonis]|uniref:DUF3027 domain-containing protein n=1 Tax=Agrococcus carbonis TaxID=684552 RepID=A0A1H1RAL7_9MICO|nr:DUF3027 domain-containing protein [Agrococcus carbonis]SDS32804.1 Protein of unknown function [Agrococcus carbonis]